MTLSVRMILPAIGLVACSSAVSATTKYEWDGNPQVVGRCFTIHGRLAQYNGGTTFRIWKIGTSRMFAVANETPLPRQITAKIRDFDTEVYGEFVVCPLTTARPGYMQMVSVKSAKNLRAKQRSTTQSR